MGAVLQAHPMNRSTEQRSKMMRGLHAEARKRGLSHDGLHELVEKRYGVRSLSQLSEAQLREWYREFSGKGFRHRGIAPGSRAWAAGNAGKKAAPDGARKVVELAGADDIAMLIDLAARIGWSVTGFHKFVARQLGREQVRTMADVNKVLWALKTIARRKGIKV
jgi:hypothetical protein